MEKINVSNKFIEKLTNVSEKIGIDYECFEGSLNDNYIFYNTDNIKITDVKQSKFIIVKEYYINEWSSGLELITTNDYNLIDYYEKLFN